MSVNFEATFNESTVNFECSFGTMHTIVPDPYTGSYTVIPKANSAVVLETNLKSMLEDVTVSKVPYYETSNPQNGLTAYIANEV